MTSLLIIIVIALLIAISDQVRRLKDMIQEIRDNIDESSSDTV